MEKKKLDQEIKDYQEKLKSLENQLKKLKQSKPDVIDLVSDDELSISSKKSLKKSNKKQPQTQPQKKKQTSTRQYIDVKFKNKQDAKKKGAKWDDPVKSWYIPTTIPNEDKQKLRRTYNPKQIKTTAKQEKILKKQTPPTQPQKQKQQQQQQQQTRQTKPKVKQKIFLNVPFADKDKVKRKGALWDDKRKLWYAPLSLKKRHPNNYESLVNNEKYKIKRNWEYSWQIDTDQLTQEQLDDYKDWFHDIKPYLEDPYWDIKTGRGKLYLNVPFKQKQDAKNLGAKFDWNKKKWYIDYSKIHQQKKEGDYERLQKYVDSNQNDSGWYF